MSFVEKLQKERGKLHSGTVEGNRFKAANTEDQLIVDDARNVHKLKAKDSSGRWAYYFVHVSSYKEAVFLRDLKRDKTLSLEKYGRVLASNYGKSPNDSIRVMLKRKYGWEIPKGEESGNE